MTRLVKFSNRGTDKSKAMKNKHLNQLVVVGGLLMSVTSFADDKTITNPDMSPIVREEFRKAREELKQQQDEAKKRLADLEETRKKVIAEYKALGAKEKNWVEHLRKYDILITGRYVDEKTGEYIAGKEVGKRDQDNLNTIFEDYLQMHPFIGRLTAEQSRKFIEEGMEKLNVLSKMHSEPTEGNNTELQIVADSKKETEQSLVKIAFLAKHLGFDLSRNLSVADVPAATQGRAPASR